MPGQWNSNQNQELAINTCTFPALQFPRLVFERENVPLPLQAINEQLHQS